MEVTMARRFYTRKEKLNHITIWKALFMPKIDVAQKKGIYLDFIEAAAIADKIKSLD